MNTKTLKGVSTVALLLASLRATVPAGATPIFGFLGGAANSIDVYTYTCPAGLIGAAARVDDRDLPFNAALVQVALSKDGFPTSQAEAPNDAGGASIHAQVLDGFGSYTVAFKKTGVGVEAYRSDVFCVQAGIPLNILQNVSALQRRIDQ